MTILNHVWPWSKIRRLEQELEASRKFADIYVEALREVDPHYWMRKQIDATRLSPRLKSVLMGIEKP